MILYLIRAIIECIDEKQKFRPRIMYVVEDFLSEENKRNTKIWLLNIQVEKVSYKEISIIQAHLKTSKSKGGLNYLIIYSNIRSNKNLKRKSNVVEPDQ